MTHPYIANGQAWAFALRLLMNYSWFRPVRHGVVFASSGPRCSEGEAHLAGLALEMGCDMVHLTFPDIDSGTPSEIGLLLLGVDGTQWLPGCRLFAASTTAPVLLLHGDRAWHVDERNQLVSRRLPPRHLRQRGEQIAWDRLRETAMTMGPVALEGDKWVAPGQACADGIDFSTIKVAT